MLIIKVRSETYQLIILSLVNQNFNYARMIQLFFNTHVHLCTPQTQTDTHTYTHIVI